MSATATSDVAPPGDPSTPTEPATRGLTPVTLFNGWLGRCDWCDEVVIHATGEEIAEDVARHFDCERATALACGVRIHVVLADLQRFLARNRFDEGALLLALRDLPEIPDAEAALHALRRARARRQREPRLERAIDVILFAMRRLRGRSGRG